LKGLDILMKDKKYNELLELYKKQSNRLALIIKQSDKQQITVLKLHDELIEHKKNLELKVKKKTEELHELNVSLEQRVKDEIKLNQIKDQQLLESSKMAQMGEMIGNIAHQWRQPLSAISTTISGIQLQKTAGLEIDSITLDNVFDNVMNKTEYLSSTIEDFRNFIKDDKSLSNIDAKDLINSTLSITEDTIKHLDIKLTTNLEDDCMFNGVQGEISQVILNLINNARDILAKNKNKEKLINISSYKKDDKIKIKVSDNGGGIPKKILPKIFDLYFTTKHQAQGTGIGLYMSKRIIENHHNGKLIGLNKNDGASFEITLPAI
jgi:signal transduction histidine kinase